MNLEIKACFKETFILTQMLIPVFLCFSQIIPKHLLQGKKLSVFGHYLIQSKSSQNNYSLTSCLAAMGPMVVVVEGAGPIRVTASRLAKGTISRATEATARAPTTTLAPTTREATAATVKASQVGAHWASVAALTWAKIEEENKLY